jgi:hypothetical protein
VGFVEAPLVAISGATLGLVAAGGFLHSASWIPPWLLYGSLVIPRISSIEVGWLLRVCFLPPAFFCFVLACKPCRDPGLTCKQESGSTQLGVPTRGAISQQTSPLPSFTVSYPSPTQDPVAPPKRVVVGRLAALRLRLLSYLTPTSKNQGQPSSGCRQGGRYHKKPRHCPLALSPIRHPPKTPLLHQNESSSNVRQRYGSVFVRA